MNYDVLKTELDIDPLTRGYAGMNDEAASDDLNTVYRTKAITSVTGADIFNETDDTEFDALAVADQDRWINMCAVGQINVTSGVAKSIERDLFGPGTVTRSNLLALKTQDISRGIELDLGEVRAGDVQFARVLP